MYDEAGDAKVMNDTTETRLYDDKKKRRIDVVGMCLYDASPSV